MLAPEVPIVIMASAQWETATPVNVHQIARRFARRGHRVLFVESTGLRAPVMSSGRDWTTIRNRLKGWHEGPRHVEDDLWVLSPLALPMRGPKPLRAMSMRAVGSAVARTVARLGMERPVLWCFLPTHVLAAPRIDHRVLVYHCVDHYAANPGVDRPWIELLERRMLGKAGCVIASSGVLANRLGRDRNDVKLLPNVADVELFSKAATENLPEPEDLRGIPHPRLVYIGNLARYRIDLPLLDRLAIMNPERHIFVVGVVGSGDTSSDDAALNRFLGRPNVHLLGPKPQTDLPACLKHCDVALIPFLDNEHTRGSLPMKFWEYIAAGIPVVATDLPNFQEPAQQQLVRVAKTPDQWHEAIEASLNEPSKRRRTRIDAARAHGWPARIEELAALLEVITRTP